MAYRGRGRGGRGGGYSFRAFHGKPFVLFPEGVELPDRNDVPAAELELINRTRRLQHFWKNSAYNLGHSEKKKSAVTSEEQPDVEKYSDTTKKKRKAKSEDYWEVMKCNRLSFPFELIKDVKLSARPRKKIRWEKDAEPDTDVDKLTRKHLGAEDENEKRPKDGNNSEEEQEEVVEEDDEFSSDGDYNQNVEFDDDEDDYNMGGDNDDEPQFYT